MSDDSKIKYGYWSIATQKHLTKYKADSANLDEFDSLSLSGKAGRLLGVIRGSRSLDKIKKVEKMASSIGIGKAELHRIILPELVKASNGQVEIRKNSTGEILGVEEYIFSQNNALAIAGQVFENVNPSNIERITIETMDETKRIPYLESELYNELSSRGFGEKEIGLACALQVNFKLIEKISRGKEAIYSNEYIWGPNHEKIAHAIAGLQLDKKQSLKHVIDIIQTTQGIPLEKLPPVSGELMMLAQKVGIIDPTTIITSNGVKKQFGFSSRLLSDETPYGDDILDDVKLFLASIRFGENYTQYSTINNPAKFISYFLRNGTIGPHSANGTDYTLLEERGIVRAEQSHSNRYYLHLVREDVAKEALRIISTKHFGLDDEPNPSGAEAILKTGVFQSPEECRLEMGKMPENIQEAMDHLSRVLRDESL